MTILLAVLGVIVLYFLWRQATRGRIMREARYQLRRFRRDPHTDAYDVSRIDLEFQEHLGSCLENLACYVGESPVPSRFKPSADQAADDLRFVSAVVAGTVPRHERQSLQAQCIDSLFGQIREALEEGPEELWSPLGSLNG